MARVVRNLSGKLENFSEFVEQANEAFEGITKNLDDLEKFLNELFERVTKLESYHKPSTKGKKVSEED